MKPKQREYEGECQSPVAEPRCEKQQSETAAQREKHSGMGQLQGRGRRRRRRLTHPAVLAITSFARKELFRRPGVKSSIQNN